VKLKTAWFEFIRPGMDVPKKGGRRGDRASIADNTRAARCTPFPLFMCVYLHPLGRRREVCWLMILLIYYHINIVTIIGILLIRKFLPSSRIRSRRDHQLQVCWNIGITLSETKGREQILSVLWISGPRASTLLSSFLATSAGPLEDWQVVEFYHLLQLFSYPANKL